MEIVTVGNKNHIDLTYLARFYFQMHKRTREEQAKCL